MKQAQLKSIFVLGMMFALILGIAYAFFTVDLNYPSSEWVLTNSVPFNFTANTSSSSITYCALYVNNSGTLALKANYTNVVNGTKHIAGVTINDSAGGTFGYYGWNVTCNNASNEVSAIASFGVDGNVPSISLDSPANNVYIINLNNTLFKFTPTDTSNPDSCLFYTNLSGVWKSNITNVTYTSGTQIGINLSVNADNYTAANIPDRTYAWGVTCNDTAGNGKFIFTSNRTFTLDSAPPSPIQFLVPTVNASSINSTPYFAWNQTTEANFDKYLVLFSPYKNMSDPIQSITITSITSNSTVLSNIEKDGTYFIQVQAYDLAGQYFNTTLVMNYTLDRIAVVINMSYPSPSNNSFVADNTTDFNITAVDNNLDSCSLLLSKQGGSALTYNLTLRSGKITNGTLTNLTIPTTEDAVDGVYQFNVECNDTVGVKTNFSSSYLQITIDTKSPSAPFIISTFHQTNSTNKIPDLLWNTVIESNFSKYQVRASYTNNNSVAYERNITSKTTNFSRLNLSGGFAYTFNVTVYDLAGNTNSSGNTTDQTRYYADSVCGVLVTGWNLCGAVWTFPKSLSLIANETGASQVAVWNSSHKFATCNAAVSPTGQHCSVLTNISNSIINSSGTGDESKYDTSVNHAVWVYMNSTGDWNNRTWVAVQASSNITLTNASGIGWNLEAGFVRGGKVFGHIKNQLLDMNVSMFSMPLNNGTTVAYVNRGLFKALKNQTNLDYGRGIWIFYNGTHPTGSFANHTFDVGLW